MYSFMYLFMYSFIRSFIRSFFHSCKFDIFNVRLDDIKVNAYTQCNLIVLKILIYTTLFTYMVHVRSKLSQVSTSPRPVLSKIGCITVY